MYSNKHTVIMVLLLSISSSAQWLQFGAGCPEGSEPRTVHNITLDDLITFDVELQGLLADTIVNDSIPYISFNNSPGITPMDSVGFPELPTVVCLVAVPDDADLELSCLSELPETIALDIDVYPAPLDSLFTDSTTTPYIGEYFVKDSSAYVSEEWYPEELAEIGEEETGTSVNPPSISASCNPVTGSVSFTVTGITQNELDVYDISGRLVMTVPVSNGAAFWDGRDAWGERLPYGVYRVSSGEACQATSRFPR